MFLVVRTLVYATFFVGLLLVWLPARVLAWSGMARPEAHSGAEIAGWTVTALGALLVLWCVTCFIRFGHGTPAPFDAPRRLVVRGPYHFVRNPMYIGAALTTAGAAIVYQSAALLSYACIFLLFFHAFVVLYEEPTLRHHFGQDYESYCRRVHRWRPVFCAFPVSGKKPIHRSPAR